MALKTIALALSGRFVLTILMVLSIVFQEGRSKQNRSVFYGFPTRNKLEFSILGKNELKPIAERV